MRVSTAWFNYICAKDNCSPRAACKILPKFSFPMQVLDVISKFAKLVDSILTNFGQVVDNLIKGFACGLHL
jgi:hypothetical protein